MTDFKIYKLRFTTPVHFGDNRDDYAISMKTLQSDALYAALMASLAKIGITIPDNGDLGFVISSLFPYYQTDKSNSDAVYFLPKPLGTQLPKLSNLNNAKKIKKVEWIDIDYMQKIVNGETFFQNDNDIDKIQGSFLSSKDIDKDFIESQVSPRVTITSRIGDEDAKPFYMDRISFKGDSGLYFIAQGDCELLEKALNVLQYEGIGTDRNIGNGFFEVSRDIISLKFRESDFVMNLSSFIPDSKEQLLSIIDDDKVAYDFIRRGGWITTFPHNTLRKSFIYAFTPGSVMKYRTDKLVELGSIKDLTPSLPKEMKINHKIWRSGKALFIPIILN